MILFNWKTVVRRSNGSVNRLLAIMKYITYRPIPKDYSDINQQFTAVDWSGKSFLLNPEALFADRWLNKDKDLVSYIGLASLRSFAEYKTIGKTTLDLFIVEDREGLIKQNSLLYIENELVHFKYEEAHSQEKKKHGS